MEITVNLPENPGEITTIEYGEKSFSVRLKPEQYGSKKEYIDAVKEIIEKHIEKEVTWKTRGGKLTGEINEINDIITEE